MYGILSHLIVKKGNTQQVLWMIQQLYVFHADVETKQNDEAKSNEEGKKQILMKRKQPMKKLTPVKPNKKLQDFYSFLVFL